MKEWCVSEGVADCTCEPGECMAIKYGGMITDLNILLGYGIDIDEAAEEVREKHS